MSGGNMNEQKLSRIAAVVYGIAALAVILVFTLGSASSKGVTVQSSAEGFKGIITLEVKIADGEIKAAQLISSEDSDFTQPMIEALLDKAVKNGGTAGLDATAGATYSTTAVLKALNEAVEKADAE